MTRTVTQAAVKRILTKWEKEGLSAQEAPKLLDLLYVTGQQLYECEELPEWKGFIDRYQQHWLAEDPRFRHTYAVLENCPRPWQDKKGYYKRMSKPSQWITRRMGQSLGLSDDEDGTKGSIERVGAALKARLALAEQNIRLFLALRAVIDTAAQVVELEMAGNEGVLVNPHTRLGIHIDLYNLRLEELKEKRQAWESADTRLEKALTLLPAIDVTKLQPSPDSLKELKGQILDDARGENWLRTKVRSLVSGDGVTLNDLLGE